MASTLRMIFKDNLSQQVTLILVGLIGFLVQSVQAQLYPGLDGESLADAIREDYTPSVLLDDTEAKDTLYAKIFFTDDSVRCIYSGLSRFLPNDVDPSQWLYNDGLGVESMNLEHGWPRSKGAGDGTGGNTNMYHLYPSRTGINSDRAAHPFGEINDNQTERWYYKSMEMSSIPSGDRSRYSEYINGSFEPRESVKGDIARAMFYFWTIYRSDAIAADPFYFESQLEDLCLWHNLDPVDENELSRNALIATYQGGVDNPFIIDCSLAMRAYCSDLPECEAVSVKPADTVQFELYFIREQNQIRILGDEQKEWKVDLYDLLGRKVYTADIFTGELSESIAVPNGIYVVTARHSHITLVDIFYFY